MKINRHNWLNHSSTAEYFVKMNMIVISFLGDGTISLKKKSYFLVIRYIFFIFHDLYVYKKQHHIIKCLFSVKRVGWTLKSVYNMVFEIEWSLNAMQHLLLTFSISFLCKYITLYISNLCNTFWELLCVMPIY